MKHFNLIKGLFFALLIVCAAQVKAQTYTVAEAIDAYTAGEVKAATVNGYIVGVLNGSIDKPVFAADVTVYTNLLLADNADETDVNNCIPVQLPSGAVRSALNLVDNPGNYKRFVALTGTIEAYFKVAGLKNVNEYSFDDAGEPETPVTPETPVSEYVNEAFTSGFGSFTTQETVGSYPWVSDSKYGAKASGFANGASQDAESWLISSAMDFSNETAAYIAFDYVINKGDASAAAANHKLLITTNYTGDVATTEWSEVDYGAVNNNTWDFHNTGDIALPASVMGKGAVVFAFKYMSTTANSSTWEIKNLVVTSATGNVPVEPEQPEEPETPVEPETPEIVVGENILVNGGFEEWNGDVPTAWGNDGSNATAHKATIAQSTDADSGIYAVEVAGASSNKRLASKAYTLPAGTYSLSAFIKQGGDAEGAFKLGYAIIKNGAIANSDYIYLHKEAVTATEEWEYYAVEFTLEEETTVSVLVMNHNDGNGASILVDDVELIAQSTTAIEVAVEDSNAESLYYDLSGRVVKNPANGIYICNGKKVLVK